MKRRDFMSSNSHLSLTEGSNEFKTKDEKQF